MEGMYNGIAHVQARVTEICIESHRIDFDAEERDRAHTESYERKCREWLLGLYPQRVRKGNG